MLKQLDEFRWLLDDVMLQAFGKRIVLYGYGRSGQFIRWYAEYYHNLHIDYIITEDWESPIPHEFPLFRRTILDFDYGDVRNAVIWLAVPDRKEAVSFLTERGYVKNETYYDLCEKIYGNDIYVQQDENATPFFQKKIGYRDVQFMEWLEYKYDCNFVTAIKREDFTGEIEGHHQYSMTSQKEIFPILDNCHIDCLNAAIFDFGCGKGGGMTTFLDYGLTKVGGVEYEKNIYGVLQDNMKKLDLENKVSVFNNDAAELTTELDEYNWFYFYDPFTQEIYEKVIKNIADSVRRKSRKIWMIIINPSVHSVLKEYKFKLTNQFCIETRQKVVSVYTNQV